jgi:hypothetical protein
MFLPTTAKELEILGWERSDIILITDDGYRPGKSAIDAVGVKRKKCWRYDWVLDLDIGLYLHRLISGFMANTLHFGTDNITKVMICGLV